MFFLNIGHFVLEIEKNIELNAKRVSCASSFFILYFSLVQFLPFDFSLREFLLFYFSLREFLPMSFMKVKNVEKRIFAEHKTLVGLSGSSIFSPCTCMPRHIPYKKRLDPRKSVTYHAFLYL